MAKLYDLTVTCRSKNAGPFMCTMDLFFDNVEVYNKVKASNIFTKVFVADLYEMPLKNVYGVFYVDDCMAIKISLYKEYIVGDYNNRDVFNCMQHIPLYDIEIAL